MQFLVAGGSLQKISDMQIKQEQALHINALELLGGKIRLLGFFKDNKEIKLVRVMDNNSTVANINYMGGVRFDLCDDIAFTIWQWTAKQQLRISAANITGSENVIGDKNSRKFERSSEWKLTEGVFKQMISTFGKPDADLFVSRINHQLSNYISWTSDLEPRLLIHFP